MPIWAWAAGMKNLTWLADSRPKVESFRAGVQDDAGYALYAAQLGEQSPKAKALHGFGPGVTEVAVRDFSGAYRVICAACRSSSCGMR